MLARRSGPLLVVALLTVAGCKEVKQHSPTQDIVVATYSPPSIPTPNDFAMQSAASFAGSAQGDLLQSLVNQGGFPADQAPTLTIPLAAYAWNASTNVYDAAAAPTADPATLTTDTVALFKLDDAEGPVRITVEPTAIQPAGAVTLVPAKDAAGNRRLAAGRYVFAIRGGTNGVKTTAGLPIQADKPVALSIPNTNLADPANQPPGGLTSADLAKLVPIQQALWNPTAWLRVNPGAGNVWFPCIDSALAQFPTLATACASANSGVKAPAYTAIDAAFPHDETASITTFQIAVPTGATVAAFDAGTGKVPLPIDLLRTGQGGHIAYNPAFGAAAQGLTSLTGFSTTAMLLAPVATPGSSVTAIDAGTVHGANVFLYKLGGEAPELLPELKYEIAKGAAGNPASARYVAEPSAIVVPQGSQCPIAGGCSTVIGLQPAVNTGMGLYLPPLEESTKYAVVITSRVHDLAGNGIARPSIMTLLTSTHPLAASGASLVGGVDAATATVMEQMRLDLQTVFANLPAGTTASDVALAYTFTTQPITPTALSIAALPYQTGAGVVAAADFLTPAQVAAQYGIDVAHLPAAPAGPIAEFAEVTLPTVSLLLDSQNSGLFDPDHPAVEPVKALVAVPNPLLVAGSCPAGFTASHCAPLVVFRHGITRSKADLLPIAAALTARGFVVAAIDSEKHGDRSYCTSDAQCCPAALCGTASTCSFKSNLTTPTDGTTQIGVCESSAGVRGSYLNKRVDCAQPFEADGVTPNPACLSPKGVPYVSANFLVSMNFFRTRDSLRQDIIDQSALVKALAPTAASSDAFAAHLLATEDIAVDPDKVYWVSQSLGSIQGAVDIAVNPRISRAVFSVPGATVVDIFADPSSQFNAALLDLIAPIEAGTAEYLQLLQVAKWILDPADPANFGSHVIADPLTGPLNASFPNPDRTGAILTQNALCDNTVPNRENAFFASQLGLGVPSPGTAGDSFVQWYLGGASGTDCASNTVTHGFLLDGANLSLTSKAQLTAGAFLASPAAQLTTVRP